MSAQNPVNKQERAEIAELVSEIRDSLTTLNELSPIMPKAEMQVFIAKTATLMQCHMLGNQDFFKGHGVIQNALKFIQGLEMRDVVGVLSPKQIQAFQGMQNMIEQENLIVHSRRPGEAHAMRHNTGNTGLLHSGNLREQGKGPHSL